MISSYAYTLCRRAVVVTMDLSTFKLHLFHTDHWLSDAKNVCQLWLTAPAWTDGANMQAAPQAPARRRMSSWSVAAVIQYLEKEDAAGVAVIMKNNSVNGADLLEMTTATCTEALRCTPFAACKLMQLRDKYLNQ